MVSSSRNGFERSQARRRQIEAAADSGGRPQIPAGANRRTAGRAVHDLDADEAGLAPVRRAARRRGTMASSHGNATVTPRPRARRASRCPRQTLSREEHALLPLFQALGRPGQIVILPVPAHLERAFERAIVFQRAGDGQGRRFFGVFDGARQLERAVRDLAGQFDFDALVRCSASAGRWCRSASCPSCFRTSAVGITWSPCRPMFQVPVTVFGSAAANAIAERRPDERSSSVAPSPRVLPRGR